MGSYPIISHNLPHNYPIISYPIISTGILKKWKIKTNCLFLENAFLLLLFFPFMYFFFFYLDHLIKFRKKMWSIVEQLTVKYQNSCPFTVVFVYLNIFSKKCTASFMLLLQLRRINQPSVLVPLFTFSLKENLRSLLRKNFLKIFFILINI